MKKLICILILTAFSTLSAWTQRQQHLGRGVVATYHAETGITISWRGPRKRFLQRLYQEKGGIIIQQTDPQTDNADQLPGWGFPGTRRYGNPSDSGRQRWPGEYALHPLHLQPNLTQQYQHQ